MKKFFEIVFATCKGTAVFPLLLHVPVWISFVHLCLMALILSAFITVVNYSPLSERTHISADILAEQFGSFTMSADGIYPEKEPGVSRSFELPGLFQVKYFADPKDISADDVFTAVGHRQ